MLTNSIPSSSQFPADGGAASFCFSLPPEQLAQVFPFHLVFNGDRQLVQMGKAIAKLYPELEIGCSLDRHFRIKRPSIKFDIDRIKKNSRSLFLLESLTNGMLLKGQMVYVRESEFIFFLGSPWITELASLKSFGLTLNDFATHDPVVDFLFLVQAQNTALAEAKASTEKLTQQQTKLRQSNQKLAIQYAVTRILEESSTFNEAAVKILAVICETLNWQVGVLWIVDPLANLLKYESIWQSVTDQFEAFEADNRTIAFKADEELPGVVWQTGNHIWIDDIASINTSPRMNCALEVGLHSTLSFPIKKGSQVIGVFEFFRNQIFQSDESFLEVIDDTSIKIGQFAQRKEVEVAKEVADAANLAKSKFLANMSHELRTPLNGILGYAQILRQSQTMTERERKGIEIINQCGSHLLTLINDILDLSKIEAGKMDLHPTDFDFTSFLQGVIEICRIKAEQKGIEFVCETPQKMPVALQADEKRLRQVLMNLLSNGIKFTDKGRVNFVVTTQKTSGSQADGRQIYCLRFLVKDTGVGISSEHLEKIFYPFEQVGSVKKQAEGTGLGLAISQRIVAMMNSTLNVHSEVGQGSIFWFDVEIPEATEWIETSKQVQPSAIVGFKGEKSKILAIDDNLENRSVIVNLLEPLGFVIKEAENGQDGLDKAAKWQPDLIITDLSMPVMDGYEMLAQLRQENRLPNVIAIASSASVFESDRQKSLAAGANDFLPKPIQTDTLLTLLQTHLQLEWVYERSRSPEPEKVEIKPKLAAAEITPPSVEDLTLLLDLSRRGLINNLLQESDRIASLDSKFIPFTNQICQLAKSFQIKQIRALIEQYI